MKLKPGVRLLGVQPQLIVALLIADSVWHAFKLPEMTVTSVTDGTHSKRSLHYKGMAADIRTRDLDPDLVPKLVGILKQWLGDEYDVVLETSPPHIHVEWDPER